MVWQWCLRPRAAVPAVRCRRAGPLSHEDGVPLLPRRGVIRVISPLLRGVAGVAGRSDGRPARACRAWLGLESRQRTPAPRQRSSARQSCQSAPTMAGRSDRREEPGRATSPAVTQARREFKHTAHRTDLARPAPARHKVAQGARPLWMAPTAKEGISFAQFALSRECPSWRCGTARTPSMSSLARSPSHNAHAAEKAGRPRGRDDVTAARSIQYRTQLRAARAATNERTHLARPLGRRGAAQRAHGAVSALARAEGRAGGLGLAACLVASMPRNRSPPQEENMPGRVVSDSPRPRPRPARASVQRGEGGTWHSAAFLPGPPLPKRMPRFRSIIARSTAASASCAQPSQPLRSSHAPSPTPSSAPPARSRGLPGLAGAQTAPASRLSGRSVALLLCCWLGSFPVHPSSPSHSPGPPGHRRVPGGSPARPARPPRPRPDLRRGAQDAVYAGPRFTPPPGQAQPDRACDRQTG